HASTVRQSPGATRSSPAIPVLRTMRAHAPTFAEVSGRTRTMRTTVKRTPGLLVALGAGRYVVDVRVQPADLLVLLGEVHLQEVAEGDDTEEAVARDYREVPAAGLLALADRVAGGALRR